ncbi:MULTISPECIES: hypothetical protein [Bacteria]|uniref:hypothetical protein n=1 Tax=Bacteria TaxID=2 RepID=UPI003C7DFA76
MTSDPDDALRWDGDEPVTDAPATAADAPAKSADAGDVPSAEEEPSLPAGWTAVGRGSEKVRVAEAGSADALDSGRPAVEAVTAAEVSDERPGLGNASLISLGVIGGVYLLYAIGWAVGGSNLRPSAKFLVTDAMYLPWMWLVILAPFLWFVAVWVLTRGRATWIRIVGLVIGVVLLIPWPFVMTGVLGS